MSLLTWLFTDKENAARGAAADAELRRIRDERIASGYYTPEQVEAVNRSYETDAYLNEQQAEQAISGAFWEGWGEGRRNVSGAITGTLNRIVADPLRAVVGGVPWWLWLAGIGAAIWYFKPLLARVRKLFVVAALAAVPISLDAGQARFAWNPSPTEGVTNYLLYASETPLTETNLHQASVRVGVGTNLTATALFTNAGTWHLRVTAQMDGVESEPSNELVVLVPEPATEFASVAIEHTLTLTGTNWQDVGFFRLRIER